MNRAELVEQAALALYYEFAGSVEHTPADFRDEARVVVDALLPQITTVEEVEALPHGSVVVDGLARPWRADDARWWWGTATMILTPAELVARGPLTVVWQPR